MGNIYQSISLRKYIEPNPGNVYACIPAFAGASMQPLPFSNHSDTKQP